MQIKKLFLERSQNLFDVYLTDSPDYSFLSEEIEAETHVGEMLQARASFSGLTTVDYDVDVDVFDTVLSRNVRTLYADLQAQYNLSQSSAAQERAEAWKGDTVVIRSSDAYVDSHVYGARNTTDVSNDYLEAQLPAPTVEPTRKNVHDETAHTDTVNGGQRREVTSTQGNYQDPDVSEKVASPEMIASRRLIFNAYAFNRLYECVHRSIIEASTITEYMRSYTD